MKFSTSSPVLTPEIQPLSAGPQFPPRRLQLTRRILLSLPTTPPFNLRSGQTESDRWTHKIFLLDLPRQTHSSSMPASELLRRVAQLLRHLPLCLVAGHDRMDIRAPFPNRSGSSSVTLSAASRGSCPSSPHRTPPLQSPMPPIFSAAPPQSRRPGPRYATIPPPPTQTTAATAPFSALSELRPRQSVASRLPARPQPACLLTCAPSLLAPFPQSLPSDPPHDDARLSQISTTGKTVPARPRLWCPMTAGVILEALLRRTAAQSPPQQNTRSFLPGLRAAPTLSLPRSYKRECQGSAGVPFAIAALPPCSLFRAQSATA